MDQEAINKLFKQSGAPPATFKTHGDSVAGTILLIEHTQQRDLDGTPKEWSNGDAMMQVEVTLQTGERVDEDDDGRRRVFLKGAATSPSAFGAVAAALRSTDSELTVGGHLSMTFTSTALPRQKGFNGAKEYSATYSAPAS